MSNDQVDIDILSELKSFTDQNVIDIYLPSQKKTVKFKKLNVKQQKQLLLVALDDAKSLINFNIALYDIIHDNIVSDKNFNINIYDRNSIIFNLLKDDAVDEKRDLYTKICNNYATVDVNINDVVINNKIIHFTLSVPTFQRDYAYNKKLLTKYNLDITNKKEFIEHTYLIEIAKYISKIEITKSDKQTITTTLHDEKLESIFKIVDSLPSVNQIINFMSKVKQLEAKLNTIEKDVVDISPSLFI